MKECAFFIVMTCVFFVGTVVGEMSLKRYVSQTQLVSDGYGEYMVDKEGSVTFRMLSHQEISDKFISEYND